MAIKSNKKIDFEYEFESNNHPYSITLRFHNSEEFGPTITVLTDEGDPAISFPAGMFSEVSDFLIEQGIIEGKRSVSSPSVPQRLPKTATSQTPIRTPLPKPNIAVAKPKVNPLKVGNKQIKNVVEVDLEEDSGEDFEDAPEDMQDLLKQEQERIQGIQDGIEGAIPMQTLSNAVNQVQLTEEEAQSILSERQKALSKAKPQEKVIRKK